MPQKIIYLSKKDKDKPKELQQKANPLLSESKTCLMAIRFALFHIDLFKDFLPTAGDEKGK